MITEIDVRDVFKDRVLADKINELVGVVNALVEENNIHEKQIDELQMKVDPEGCRWDNEREWIGKLCKFRDCKENGWQYGILTDIVVGNDYPYWMGNIEFAECQPVSEDEFKNVIYRGEK